MTGKENLIAAISYLAALDDFSNLEEIKLSTIYETIRKTMYPDGKSPIFESGNYICYLVRRTTGEQMIVKVNCADVDGMFPSKDFIQSVKDYYNFQGEHHIDYRHPVSAKEDLCSFRIVAYANGFVDLYSKLPKLSNEQYLMLNRKVEGKTQRAIAAEFGMSASTVAHNLHWAARRLCEYNIEAICPPNVIPKYTHRQYIEATCKKLKK